MPRKRRIFLVLLTAIAVAVAALLACFPALPAFRAELAARDWLARHGRFVPLNPKLIFLAIDNDSMSIEADADLEFFGLRPADKLETRALRLMSSEWPWPRSVHAMIVDRLVRAGAKVVVFDLNFPTPSEEDAEFRAALERHRDRVVIGSNFVSATRRGMSSIAATHTLPSPTLIPRTGDSDDRVGCVNFWPDADGVIRRAQFRINFSALAGGTGDLGGGTYLSLAAQAVRKAGRADAIPEGFAAHAFRFTGAPHEAFPPRSVFEIFVPEYWRRNYRAGADFKDAIVMVGAAGNWQHDEHETAVGVMPGPELQLQAVNALLHGALIRPVPPLAGLAFVLAAGAGALALAFRIASPITRLLLLVCASVAWVFGALFIYDTWSLFVPVVGPVFALNCTGLFGLLQDVVIARLERGRLRATLERYVSKNVVHEMLEQPQRYMAALGGVTRPATILFSDIRSFTSLCANVPPHALVTQLNEYLTAMVECVFRHGGTLDKFIGDAVMAVWGNAHSAGTRGDARSAVRCALEMRAELRKLNERWLREGRRPLDIGIALHQGDVVVGNIGSPHRMEFTVIGDPVNICWRLQERTKLHGHDVLVSEKVAALIAPEFRTEALGTLRAGGSGAIAYARILNQVPADRADRAAAGEPLRHELAAVLATS